MRFDLAPSALDQERLTEIGYVVDEPPRLYNYSSGYYAMGFDDPDGIRLEVVFDPATNP